MAKVMINMAWPYANGIIHLGHMAGSILPPDIFRRFHVLLGNEPLMVSGSDQHGTPITVTAEKNNTTALEIAEKYHNINKKAIEDMGVEMFFTKTHTENHKAVVHDVFLTLLEKGFLYKKVTDQYYCPSCARFLPDRYVKGNCPNCGEGSKGDQCDKCGTTFETGDLLNVKCMHCGVSPEVRDTEHFFLKLSAFRDDLLKFLEDKDYWRSNVKTFTQNWIQDEVKDRAITRDMDWGLPVPMEGWDGKVIYVWFEAVIGYLSASKEFSQLIGKPDLWKEYWMDPGVKHYYFLGKDNIPFHSIIWPSILMGYGNLNLPYDIPANEYLMFKGGKLSKSKGGAIEIPDVLKKFDADVIRYYLSVNMPDTHDSEFSWEDFKIKVNTELVSALGNYYHRCLSFTKKNFGTMPDIMEEDLKETDEIIKTTLDEYLTLMNSCDLKKAIRCVMDLAHSGNKYFDAVKPWALVKSDKTKCGSVLNANLRIVKALTIMAWPFLPTSSETIWGFTGQPGTIKEMGVKGIFEKLVPGLELKEPLPVYKKIEEVDDVSGFEDFKKLDIRVGEITEAEDHPDAEKLFVLKVNVGEERQIVAGLRAYYSKEHIKGRKVLVVCNLKPAKLRGQMSEGMLLAADDEETGGSSVMLLKPSIDVENGTKMNCGLTVKDGRIEFKDFQKAVMKVFSVKDGKANVDDVSIDVPKIGTVTFILDDGNAIPLTDGKDCFATTDGEMNGARVR